MEVMLRSGFVVPLGSAGRVEVVQRPTRPSGTWQGEVAACASNVIIADQICHHWSCQRTENS